MRKRFKVSKGCFDRKSANSTNISRLATLAGEESKMPFLKDDCELVIPLTAPDKYRWWAGGQSIFETLLELDTPDSVIEHYIGPITSPADWRRWQKIMEEKIAGRLRKI